MRQPPRIDLIPAMLFSFSMFGFGWTAATMQHTDDLKKANDNVQRCVVLLESDTERLEKMAKELEKTTKSLNKCTDFLDSEISSSLHP